MFIVYDTKLRLPRTEHPQDSELALSLGPGQGLIGLSTSDFSIEYKDGKASMYLYRSLTADQLRQLGETALEMASALKNLEDSTQTVAVSFTPQNTADGSVTLTNIKNSQVIGHGG